MREGLNLVERQRTKCAKTYHTLMIEIRMRMRDLIVGDSWLYRLDVEATEPQRQKTAAFPNMRHLA